MSRIKSAGVIWGDSLPIGTPCHQLVSSQSSHLFSAPWAFKLPPSFPLHPVGTIIFAIEAQGGLDMWVLVLGILAVTAEPIGVYKKRHTSVAGTKKGCGMTGWPKRTQELNCEQKLWKRSISKCHSLWQTNCNCNFYGQSLDPPDPVSSIPNQVAQRSPKQVANHANPLSPALSCNPLTITDGTVNPQSSCFGIAKPDRRQASQSGDPSHQDPFHSPVPQGFLICTLISDQSRFPLGSSLKLHENTFFTACQATIRKYSSECQFKATALTCNKEKACFGTRPCFCPASFTPPQQRTAPWRWYCRSSWKKSSSSCFSSWSPSQWQKPLMNQSKKSVTELANEITVLL